MSDRSRIVEIILDDHLSVAQRTRTGLVDDIADLGKDVTDALRSGGKLIVFGNGGSAADAQHFSAELTGRFSRPRPALAAIALSTNTSALTAIANDFDFADVYARQVEGLCGDADIVVGISTSGSSESVVRGLLAAAASGARTWAMTGTSGGRVGAAADRVLAVPSDVTARIQEIHITVIHAVSELVDIHAAGPPSD